MPDFVTQIAATRVAKLIAKRKLSPVEVMKAHLDPVAKVKVYKQFEQFFGGVALAELCGTLPAIAEPSISDALARRRDDGGG